MKVTDFWSLCELVDDDEFVMLYLNTGAEWQGKIDDDVPKEGTIERRDRRIVTLMLRERTTEMHYINIDIAAVVAMAVLTEHHT